MGADAPTGIAGVRGGGSKTELSRGVRNSGPLNRAMDWPVIVTVPLPVSGALTTYVNV